MASVFLLVLFFLTPFIRFEDRQPVWNFPDPSLYSTGTSYGSNIMNAILTLLLFMNGIKAKTRWRMPAGCLFYE